MNADGTYSHPGELDAELAALNVPPREWRDRHPDDRTPRDVANRRRIVNLEHELAERTRDHDAVRDRHAELERIVARMAERFVELEAERDALRWAASDLERSTADRRTRAMHGEIADLDGIRIEVVDTGPPVIAGAIVEAQAARITELELEVAAVRSALADAEAELDVDRVRTRMLPGQLTLEEPPG